MTKSSTKKGVSKSRRKNKVKQSKGNKTNAPELIWNLIQLHKLELTLLTKLQDQIKKLMENK